MRGAGPLYDELHELVGVDARPTAVHRFFAALPARLRAEGAPHQLLVTTSYDLLLEQALLDAGEEFDVVSYLASGPNRGKFCHVPPDGDARVIEVPNRYATELDLTRRTVVLKLHGGVDAAPERAWESFVVTEDDYIDYLPSLDLAAAVPVALAAHLRRSHFLFLGYGMRDWNLRVVLEPALGRADGQLPLLGRLGDGCTRRARVLACARHRAAGGRPRGVRGRARTRGGDRERRGAA